MKTFNIQITETKRETTGNVEYSLKTLEENERVSNASLIGTRKEYGEILSVIEYTWSTIHIVSAETKEEAIKNLYINPFCENVKIGEIIESEKMNDSNKEKEIIDAEELLYEMDVNSINEIVVKEGFSTETTYKRDKIESYLGLNESSCKMKSSNENFINALAIYNGGSIEEVNQIVDYDMLDEIVETRETLENFISARGKYSILSENTDFGFVAMFENIQREKGLKRGDLYVVEYEDKTLCYFDGE